MKTIAKTKKTGRATEVPQHKQFLSNLFVIPKKIGDLRPVINKKNPE